MGILFKNEFYKHIFQQSWLPSYVDIPVSPGARVLIVHDSSHKISTDVQILLHSQ